MLLLAGTALFFHRRSVRRSRGLASREWGWPVCPAVARLTPDLYVEPRLRMSGAVPPLLCAFVAYAGRAGDGFQRNWMSRRGIY
jgi:hypothetical protein